MLSRLLPAIRKPCYPLAVILFPVFWWPAVACDSDTACSRQNNWFFSFNAFDMTEGAPSGRHERYRGRYTSDKRQDLQASIDVIDHKTQKHADLIVVNARAILDRGGSGLPAFLELEHVFLSVKLAAALLAQAFPNGPEAMKGHKEIALDGSSSIKVTAFEGVGEFKGAWKLRGAADRGPGGSVSYKLRFSSAAQREGKRREPGTTDVFDLHLTGAFENSSSPLFDDKTSLEGWRLYGDEIRFSGSVAPTLGEMRIKIENEEAAELSAEAARTACEMGDFIWPLKGTIISPFTEKTQGINISASEGMPVVAAKSGIVAYAGNQLKDYGNLVIIRHPEGMATAYAHNKELFVKRGEDVIAGHIIANSGRTGNAQEPQLHFEIRVGTTPVDPQTCLPEKG